LTVSWLANNIFFDKTLNHIVYIDKKLWDSPDDAFKQKILSDAEKNICFPLVFYDKTWSSHGSNLGFQIDSKIKPQTFARQERHPRKILAKFAVV
jgi:hypothetical protein